MIRTQLYLPEDLKLELELLARQEEKSTSQLIREVLSEGLKQKQKQKKRNTGTLLRELAEMAVEGPGDLSTNLFDYLYGKKSDYARGRKRK